MFRLKNNGCALLALAAMLLSSCTRDDRAALPSPAITYQVVRTASKADGTGTYDTDCPFVTWAWYLPENSAWNGSAESAKLYIPAETVSHRNGSWTTDSPYYWPPTGSLTFMSLSPATLGTEAECTADEGIILKQYDISSRQETDLMVADVASDRTSNPVPTVFRHKLSRVTGFSINTDKDYSITGQDGTHLKGSKRFFINGISILGLNSTGTFKSGANTGAASPGEWSSLASPKDFSWAGTPATEIAWSQEGTEIPGNGPGYIAVIPQTLTSQSILIEYTIRTYYDDSAPGSDGNFSEEKIIEQVALSSLMPAFAVNTRVAFSITIGLDKMNWSADVQDWDDRQGSDTTI